MSHVENMAAKAALALSGLEGARTLIIPDNDKIVTSTNMKVGAYTVAAHPDARCILSVTATAADTADTMGTVTITGSCAGTAVTETVTPVAGSTIYTDSEFDTVDSVVGAGWVIDAVEGTNDTIIIGQAYCIPNDGHYFSAVQAVAASTAVSVQTNESGATVADLTAITALPSGVAIPCKCSALAISAGEAIAYLGRE